MYVPAHFQAPVTESAHATPTRAPFPQENIYDTLAPIAGEPEVSFTIMHPVGVRAIRVYKTDAVERFKP